MTFICLLFYQLPELKEGCLQPGTVGFFPVRNRAPLIYKSLLQASEVIYYQPGQKRVVCNPALWVFPVRNWAPLNYPALAS